MRTRQPTKSPKKTYSPKILDADPSVIAKGIRKDILKLRVSEGRFSGKKIMLMPWQEQFIDGISDHRLYDIFAATMARGNGKTTFISALSTSGIVPSGTLYRPRGEIDIIASSLGQGRICFNHIYHFLKYRIEKDREREGSKVEPWRVIDNSHQAGLSYTPDDTKLQVKGSDPKRAHGLSPSMVISDEPAQWLSGGIKMFMALETALGKQVNAKFIAIGTLPDEQQHWFTEMLFDMDEDTFTLVFKAPSDQGVDNYDYFSYDYILKANPSYEYLPDLRKKIERHKKKAMRGGKWFDSWKAFRLNLGTPEVFDKESLLNIEEWTCVNTYNPAEREGPMFVAVDLGDGNSMTAFAAYWAMTGRLEVYGCFPATPTLEKHGMADGVGDRYVKMFKRRELFTYPGTATNNARFLSMMFKRFDKYDLQGVSADAYKEKVTRQAIVSSQVKGLEIDFRRVGRGYDGNADVVAFQLDVREGFLNIYPSLLMDSSIRESIITRDTNGNAALNKSRSKGRIDGTQAAIQAVGMGRRHRLPEEEIPDYDTSLYVV